MTPYVIEGGFVCHRETEHGLDESTAAFLADYFPGLQGEKKSTDLRNDLRGLRSSRRRATGYLVSLLRLLRSYDATVVASVHLKGPTPVTANALRQQGFAAIQGRVAGCLRGEAFDVVHDGWNDPKCSDRYRELLRRVAPAMAREISFRSSRESPLLQAADHVVGVVLLVCQGCLLWPNHPHARPIPPQVEGTLHQELENVIVRYATSSGERASIEIHELGARTPTILPRPAAVLDTKSDARAT